jgi:hypothetical protein
VSGPSAASDRLSLTLPKFTSRSRTKLKRPRKPTGRELWYLAFFLYNAVNAAVDVAEGAWVFGLWAAGGTIIYWHLYQRERRGDRSRWSPELFFCVAFWIIFGLATLFVNF